MWFRSASLFTKNTEGASVDQLIQTVVDELPDVDRSRYATIK
jgi:hypothetical protein